MTTGDHHGVGIRRLKAAATRGVHLAKQLWEAGRSIRMRHWALGNDDIPLPKSSFQLLNIQEKSWKIMEHPYFSTIEANLI